MLPQDPLCCFNVDMEPDVITAGHVQLLQQVCHKRLSVLALTMLSEAPCEAPKHACTILATPQ